MRKIALSGKYGKGLFALVDDADFEWLNQWKWQGTTHKGKRNIYARKITCKYGIRGHVFMHRLILTPPEGMDVDHRDGNRLNNQRRNLRVCTRSQNIANSGLHKNNTSGYKGICYDKQNKKWRAKIMVRKINISLGNFLNKEDAARAYNKAASKYYGEFAWLNKISRNAVPHI